MKTHHILSALLLPAVAVMTSCQSPEERAARDLVNTIQTITDTLQATNQENFSTRLEEIKALVAQLEINYNAKTTAMEKLSDERRKAVNQQYDQVTRDAAKEMAKELGALTDRLTMRQKLELMASLGKLVINNMLG